MGVPGAMQAHSLAWVGPPLAAAGPWFPGPARGQCRVANPTAKGNYASTSRRLPMDVAGDAGRWRGSMGTVPQAGWGVGFRAQLGCQILSGIEGANSHGSSRQDWAGVVGRLGREGGGGGCSRFNACGLGIQERPRVWVRIRRRERDAGSVTAGLDCVGRPGGPWCVVVGRWLAPGLDLSSPPCVAMGPLAGGALVLTTGASSGPPCVATGALFGRPRFVARGALDGVNVGGHWDVEAVPSGQRGRLTMGKLPGAGWVLQRARGARRDWVIGGARGGLEAGEVGSHTSTIVDGHQPPQQQHDGEVEMDNGAGQRPKVVAAGRKEGAPRPKGVSPEGMMPGGGGRGQGYSAYNLARSLLVSLSESMEALEGDMSQRELELRATVTKIDELAAAPPTDPRFHGTAGAPFLLEELSVDREALREAETSIMRLTARLSGMERVVAIKDVALEAAGHQSRELQERLEASESAEENIARLRHEIAQRDIRLAALARDISEKAQTEEEKSLSQEALRAAEVQISILLQELAQLREDVQVRDVVMAQMQREAALSTKTLQQAAQTIGGVRDHAARLEAEAENQRGLVGQAKAETAELVRKMAAQDLDIQQRDNRIEQLLASIHELDARMEQEGTDKQRAQKIALKTKEELMIARSKMSELELKVQELEEGVNSRDEALGQMQEEEGARKKELQMVKTNLASSQAQVLQLEQAVEGGRQALREEIESSTVALKSAAKREQELRMAQIRARELQAEVTTLRAMVESKEKTMSAVREETMKNADMLINAAQTRETLQEAEAKLDQLTGQVAALEEEVRSRDSLLEEIRAETFKSTEALKLAAQVNQHLNAAREREAQLEEALEEREELLSDIRRQLGDNTRAIKAEQALRQAEQRAHEVEEQNIALKQGIEARDAAIATMRAELEQNSDILGHAAETREELRRMQDRSMELERQAAQREASLAVMQAELSAALSLRSLRTPPPQPPPVPPPPAPSVDGPPFPPSADSDGASPQTGVATSGGGRVTDAAGAKEPPVGGAETGLVVESTSDGTESVDVEEQEDGEGGEGHLEEMNEAAEDAGKDREPRIAPPPDSRRRSSRRWARRGQSQPWG